MPIPIYQVDAFTNQPFHGNPAAVCLLQEQRPDSWLQNVAKEMNLSETAFLWKQDNGYLLRWFTPMYEVDLCGHATLASAHILWEQEQVAPNEPIRFQTKSGELSVQRKDQWMEMNFPAEPGEEVPPHGELLKALGVEVFRLFRNRMDYLAQVEDETIVRNFTPDYLALTHVDTRGVIVTARSSSEEYDIVSRFFAPGAGIPEDPVTGSAHCFLAPYWSPILNKTEFYAYQASPRGGLLHVSHQSNRVYISGQAITVMHAELYT